MNKEKIIDLILKSEGGLNEDEPSHVGGVSYAGITQKTYEAYKSRLPDNAPHSVRDLVGNSKTIYNFYDLYLGDFHVWELPECLQYLHADFAVNAGSAAVKIIQELVGSDVDGVWGSGTSRDVASWKQRFDEELANNSYADNEVITKYNEAKLRHYRLLADKNPDKYKRYLPGWEKRCMHVLAELQEYFEDDNPSAKVRAIEENDPVLDTVTAVNRDNIDARLDILEGHLNRFDTLYQNIEERIKKLEEWRERNI